MQTMTYQDLTRACLTTAEKLYNAALSQGGATPHALRMRNAPWALDLFGSTAGITAERYGTQWTLALPALPLDTRMTKRECDLWTAYTIHETGHAVFTDFNVWRTAVSQGLAALVNALEDVREEKQIIKGGVARNAASLLALLVEDKLAENVAAGYTPEDMDALPYTLCVYGRRELLAYHLPSLPAMSGAKAKALAWIWPALDKCQSTADVLKLAAKIRGKQNAMAAAQQAAQQAGQQGAQGSTGGGEQGEDATGAQGAGEQGEGAQSPKDASQGAQGAQGSKGDGAQQEQGAPGEGESNTPGECAQGDTSKPANGGGRGATYSTKTTPRRGDAFGTNELEASLTKAAQKAMIRDGRAFNSQEGWAHKLLGMMKPPKAEIEDVAPAYAAVCQKLDKTFPSVAKLKADLTRLVKSPERLGVENGRLAGRLDRGALSRASMGAPDCFQRREDIEGTNAAVSIVLDNSSSMEESKKIVYAHAMALAIGDALERAAVPFEVSKTGDSCGARIRILKPYNQTWRKRRPCLGDLSVMPGTHNLTGATSAVERLLQVKGVTRRLIFVLSDGADCYNPESWLLAQRLWALKGVECVGVGLCEDVSASFPDCVNVFRPEDVANAGLGVLNRRLKRDSSSQRAA